MPFAAIVKSPLNVLALNELRMTTGEAVFTIAIESANPFAAAQLRRAFERTGMPVTASVPVTDRSPLTSGALRTAPRLITQAAGEEVAVVVGDLLHGMTRWLAHRLGAESATVVDDGTTTAVAVLARAAEAETTPLSQATEPNRVGMRQGGAVQQAKFLMTRAGGHVTYYAETHPWRIPLKFFSMYPLTPGRWDSLERHSFDHTRAMLADAPEGPSVLLLGSPFVADGYSTGDDYVAMVRAVVAELGDVAYVAHRREPVELLRRLGPGVEVLPTRDCIELAVEGEIGVPRTVVGFGSTALDTLCLLYDGITDAVDARPPAGLFTASGQDFLAARTTVSAVSDRVRLLTLTGPTGHRSPSG